ncbi:MAG: bifunctional phosphopantothenoylcysteine decarboxylase/phosphopantothenate--cysteine ligase CoaBC [Candidatus Heimdallarchaeota archaeon]|nr:bifunctional phosphopantothenoylcysteine decarboxylase/phosphopantothenate--cysteine ligase CoaBC [Candidatus Heimdallarchaeota archaeon]MCK4954113.1 bifunctional phosphopantothenoylcysteine decarboxylase/phosphopantothenate--cysteine ligase CoaBC [Candidatus Heimdallarchaeota archaeon]
MSHISKEIVGTLGYELEGKVIIHCITSSISCFLAPQISRKLMRHGAKVIPVMSPEAAKFINPMIFEWATGEKPIVLIEGQVEHVRYAGLSKEKADLILIAPITANSISKIATGIMDTSVTLIAGTALGNKIPTIIVPTMHEVMMHNPAIKENIQKLEQMGVQIILPRVEEEKAKIPEIEEIVNVCIRELYTESLENKKILITAGPTRAFIDGIRFISNPSTGKMGYAIALEAWRRGGRIKLVYGVSHVEPPYIVGDTVKTESAEEMLETVKKSITEESYDYVILVGAMNDFEPEEKIDIKTTSSDKWELKLKPTKKLADIIKEISPSSKLILFKAEYKKPIEELTKIALERMQSAKADMIVANDVSTKEFGFESDSNSVIIISSEGEQMLVEDTKLNVAKKFLDFMELL